MQVWAVVLQMAFNVCGRLNDDFVVAAEALRGRFL